jgi:4-hydroxymandelate oxidase
VAKTRRKARTSAALAGPTEKAARALSSLKAAAAGASHRPDESQIYSVVFAANFTWKDIEWLRSFAEVPVLLKGVLNPEDADRAVKSGASGLIVSNHGARNLDTVPATVDALPHVADKVAGRVPVLMDGGIRRSTNVLKTLALGAKAVLIGRSYLWGLAVGGAAGVEHVVKILRMELLAAMALCGIPTLAKIDQSVVWPER